MKKTVIFIMVFILGMSLLAGCSGNSSGSDSGSSVSGKEIESDSGNDSASDSPYAEMKVGDIVQLGGYDWQVLAIEDDRALILSDKCLEKKPYHRYRLDVTWETSDMRRYLNGSFFENTFTEEEKMWITESTIVTANHWQSGTPGGNDTKDRVFLLSVEEVNEYFPDTETRFAEGLDTGEAQGWLLRSPGRESNYYTMVDGNDGSFMGGYAENQGPYTRPAMWLSTKNAVASAEAKPAAEGERYTLFDMTENGITSNAVDIIESGRDPNEAYVEFSADGTFIQVHWDDLHTGGTYDRSASGTYNLTYDDGVRVSGSLTGKNLSIRLNGNSYLFKLDDYN